MKKFRNEWKYCCDEGDIALISARLTSVLDIDEHTLAQNKYSIHSLYFDDYRNACANDNAFGVEKRFKWRIRYYDGPKKSLHLELKQKRFGYTHKESCPMTKKELKLILDNKPEEILWKTKYKLLRRFCVATMSRRFEPKVIIHYERTAYVEPITNIRITLDQNIAAGNDFEHFIDGKYMRYPIQEKARHVLEVKFDYILPSYIKDIINSHGFRQTSFSKYYLGRKKMEELI